MVQGNKHHDLFWGPNYFDGTGANPITWTTYEHALGIRMWRNDNQKLGFAQPGNTVSLNGWGPVGNFRRNGISMEFWGKDLYPILDNANMAMMALATLSGNNIGQLYLGADGSNRPYIRFYAYPFETFVSPAYADHSLVPNHIVATATPNGEIRIYGEGKLLVQNNITWQPFPGDENSQYLTLGRDNNFQIKNFEGVIYKAAVYEGALGASAVKRLALNPMCQLLNSSSGKFQPVDTPSDNQPPDSSGAEFVICDQF